MARSTDFKRRHNTTYSTLAGKSRSADSEIVDDCKNDCMVQEIKEYDRCDAFNADEIGLFFNLQHSKCLTFHGDSCHGGKNTDVSDRSTTTCNWQI
jgi:hypothetical protein